MALINPDLSGIVDGAVGDAVDWTNPFNTIINVINGNLDDANIKTAAAISLSKLATADKVRVTNSANQSVNNISNYDVLWDTETFDTNSLHSTSSNKERLTAITAGYYLMTANINWAANASGIRQISIVHSSASTIATSDVPATGAIDTANSLSVIYYMAANDYVKVVGYQNTGGALNLLSSYSSFSMTLLT